MLLTVREAAELLKTNERQIYRWVDEEEIPFERVRDQIRFNRTDLLEWATSRRLPIALEEFDAVRDFEERAPSLAEAIGAGGVHPDIIAKDRDSALRAVVECTTLPPTLDREFVLAVLQARENAFSTAIGGGIAIPHVRYPIVAPGNIPLVSVAYLREPVLFGSSPSSSVHTIFLIVSPTVRKHLQMLAHVARLLLDARFKSALDRWAGAEELVALAKQIESERETQSEPQRREEVD